MATQSGWQADLHQELNPTFFEDAVAVELPELSWNDAETLTVEDDAEQISEILLS